MLLPAGVRGTALATAATVTWSGDFVLADGTAGDVPPLRLALWRWTVALVAVAPYVLRHVRRDWPVIRRHLGFLALTALLGVSLFNTLIYTAGRVPRRASRA